MKTPRLWVEMFNAMTTVFIFDALRSDVIYLFIPTQLTTEEEEEEENKTTDSCRHLQCGQHLPLCLSL